MHDILKVILAAVLVKNVIFSRFLGICPYIGVSRRIETALGMGFAVTFVMTAASAITWPIHYCILVPLHIEFLQTVFFILIIAALVQSVEIALRKILPDLYKSLGIYLPLITTNCAILGVTIININKSYNFPNSLLFSFASAIGFTLAIVLFAGIRERLDLTGVPEIFEGAPIALITAGLLALAFMGFAGLG